MSLCPFCGAPLPENGRFCPRCGANLAELTPPAAPETPVIAREPEPTFAPEPGSVPVNDEAALVPLDDLTEAARDKAFRELRMHLHQESKAWRFGAIGILVMMMSIAGLFFWLGGFAGFSISGNFDDEAFFITSFFSIYGLLITVMLLPVVIVGFVMGSKTIRYYNESAANCENALKHAGSVGVIVLGAFFSTPALIFIIINFVKTKKRRAALEAVLARQKAAGGAVLHG